MEKYITLLYVVIFKFLCDIMISWSNSRWQRTLQSFNGNFVSKRITEAREEIKGLAEKLQREANHATQEQISRIPGKEYFERMKEEFFQILGEETARMLEGQQAVTDYVTRLEIQLSRQAQATSIMGVTGVDLNPMQDSSSDDFDTLFEQLNRYYGLQERRLGGLIERSLNLYIDDEVMRRIQGWFKEPMSKTLWICGAFPAPFPSRNTLIGAYITRLARKAGIPVLAYFCRHSIESYDGPGVEPMEEELVYVVYSLILQMLQALKQSTSTHLSHMVQRCKKLEGSKDSLPEAVALLNELIEAGPGLVFCIVDGVQDLAQRAGHDRSFQMLLDVLYRNLEDACESAQIVKTLFTTDGFAPILAHLRPDERLNLSDVVGQNVADFGPGYSRMAFLAL